MTVEQIKQGIEQSSPEERQYLAAFLKHLARKEDPAYQAELSALSQEIESGQKFSLEQVKRFHETLKSEGL